MVLFSCFIGYYVVVLAIIYMFVFDLGEILKRPLCSHVLSISNKLELMDVIVLVGFS